jgi:hypothetical protein
VFAAKQNPQTGSLKRFHTGTLTDVSEWDNAGGRGEKRLQAPSGQWCCILANGDLYRWDGDSGATGTVLGTVGAGYDDDPTRQTRRPTSLMPS